MTHCIRNERGFAVVYGLVILVLVTIGGTALLFLAQKDRVNAGDYSKMRSTAQAAEAALKACEGQFLNHPDIALTILKKYKLDPTYKYILNASDAAANVKTKYQMEGAGSPEYIAELKGFDQDKQIVLIEGTGFGDNGGKKKILASYQLEGLKMVTPAAPITGGRYALYLAQDGENFNYGVTITGNVYIGGTFRTQANTVPIIINGNLKTGNVSTAATAILSLLRINGNAYFQSTVSLQNTSDEITGLAGFERSPALGANLTIRDNVFTNAGATGSGKLLMQPGKTLLHSGSFPAGSMTGGTLTSNGGTIGDIATRLGMCTGNEAPVTIDITKIPSSYHKSYATVMGSGSAALTAPPINNYYTNNPSALWNGYLVIKIGASDWPNYSSSPGTFNHKVIWIFENKSINIPNTQFWYTSGANSITVIYAGNGAQLNPFNWAGTLRGYLYATGNGRIQYWANNQILQGAINHVTNDLNAFEITGTGTNIITINYDEAVINDLVGTGLATWPTLTCSGGGGGGGGGGAAQLTLVDKKIRPKLLSIQM